MNNNSLKFETLKKDNKKKILIGIGVLSVLVVTITIVTTRAKYRLTQTVKLAEGTINYKVPDLNIIAMYKETSDGYQTIQSLDELSGGNYEFNAEKSVCGIYEEGKEKIERTGITTKDEKIEITYVNKEINVSHITKKGTKCYLYFNKVVDNTITITDKYTEGSTTMVYDEHNNLRYMGANPDNYIYFNCSDYGSPSDSTCEKWRIIGVMKNMTTSDGTTEDLIKIMLNDSIGDTKWDTKSVTGKNDWTQAELNTELNTGTFYTTTLKNDVTRNMIQSVVWNLGGGNQFITTAAKFYEYERRTITWTGAVGLMYPSDYGYATSGGSISRATCLGYNLGSWNSYPDCYNNDWIYNSSISQWTLTPDSGTGNRVWSVFSNGSVDYGSADNDRGVRPVVYLKSDVLLSGEGSSSNPYVLS